MSIIFGIRRPNGVPATQKELQDLGSATHRYAVDGMFVNIHQNIGMGFQPFHTHKCSELERQPIIDPFGNMLSLDGRIDNWRELQNQVAMEDGDPADSLIVLAAFRKWGEDCFSRLIGDWALALWISETRTVYLARDHAGARSLYYSISEGVLRWSTYLETFLADRSVHSLDEDYVACYLGAQPIRDLTPYHGIRITSSSSGSSSAPPLVSNNFTNE
jgi:asparagine synthase (glutamine-hydrolysing)